MFDDRSNPVAGLPPQPSKWLLAGTYLSISIAVLCLLTCLWLIVDEAEAKWFNFMMAGIIAPIGSLLVFLQFQAVFARRKDSARFAGGSFVLLGLILWFVVVTSVGESILIEGKISFSLQGLIFLNVLVVLATGSICLGILTYRWGRALDRYEKSEPLCPQCGYSLRGMVLPGLNKCPECGEPLRTT